MKDAVADRSSLRAIRGMKDILPQEVRYYQFLEEIARRLFELYGYREIRTPVLEPTELFARSVGEASDIVVSKQMYTFVDPGERSNTMRPEGTAGVVRALIENGVFKETSQQKLYYIQPMFRYEKPQKGRLRQFLQFGLEFFGVEHPGADAEVIILSERLLREAGFTDPTVKLNNIGCRECRRDYNEKLKEAIAEAGATTTNGNGWCEQCLERARINPMRVFDCKVDKCRGIVPQLPRISDFVCEECRQHFNSVLELLDEVGLQHELDPELVRGLDYYSRTVFEIVQEGLGAQNAVLGGGRYDYLVEELGGPETPAVGVGFGIERIILAMEAAGIEPPEEKSCEYYILALDEASLPAALRIAELARKNRICVSFDCQPRSARAGLKAANRSGAMVALIIGSDELAQNVVKWKNLETSEEFELEMDELERNLISD